MSPNSDKNSQNLMMTNLINAEKNMLTILNRKKRIEKTTRKTKKK